MFWDISKVLGKIGNFEILSIGTHQNLAFTLEVLIQIRIQISAILCCLSTVDQWVEIMRLL